MTLEEFFAQPAIADQMPVFFDGNAKWESCELQCADCSAVIESSRVRGYVIPCRRGYREKLPNLYHVQAGGLCPACERLTACEIYLGPGVAFVQRNGQWYALGNQVPRWRKWLRKLWTIVLRSGSRQRGVPGRE